MKVVHTDVSNRFGRRCAALLALLALAGVSVAVEPPVRQVLVLQSFDRGNLILDHFTTNLRVDLDQCVGDRSTTFRSTWGRRVLWARRNKSIVDFIRSTFADRPKPDLIVTIAGPAAVFARKYRQQLFPESPLLLASVDQRYLGDAPLAENEAAVTVLHDFPGLIDDILQVRPRPGRCSWW